MSSESDDDSDTEIISKKLSITSKASDIIEVSSDEEEVSCLFFFNNPIDKFLTILSIKFYLYKLMFWCCLNYKLFLQPPPTPLKPKLDGTVRQTTLESFIKPSKDKLPTPPVVEPTKNCVTQVEYDAQSQRVGRLEEDLARANVNNSLSYVCKQYLFCFGFFQNVLRSVNLSGLPDNGQLLLQRHDKLNKELREEKIKLGKMVVRPGKIFLKFSSDC